MTKKRHIAPAGAVALALVAAGCGGGSKTSGVAGVQTTKSSNVLVGAGSTLVAPLVARWSGGYAKRHGVTITYGPIGSGGGIAQATAKTVDFGASDAPLQPDQRSAAPDLVQIPWALAATVIAVDLPGVGGHPRLTGPVLADIYSGKVTRWDDPEIARLNGGLALPHLRIAPLYRSDSSGDTYAFTNYLAAVSPSWRAKVGAGTDVSWPAGSGAKGNAGMAAALTQTKGAIAYIAIGQATASRLNFALLRNASGRYPVPSPATIAAAAQSTSGTNLVDSRNGYPISTFTYVLVPRSSSKLAALKQFLRYAVGPGQSFATKLSFAPLPRSVQAKDLRLISGL